MNSNKNIPQLRFPEFNGEWEEKVMSDVFTRRTEKNAEDNKNVLTISAQYGLISQLEFFKKSVSAADVTGYYLLHKGDFAYNKSSSQGKPVGAIKPLKLYEKGVVSTLYIVFRCKDPNAIGFWEQYFDAGIFDNEIMSIAQEGARNHGLLNVPTNAFFGLNVLSPSPAEQQKIAECLSEIDNLIAAQDEKVDALKEKKKGLMQKIFPQHGELTPRLRFSGYVDAWEETTLDKVAPVIFDGTHQTPHYTPNGVPFYSIENVVSNKPCKFISEDEHKANTKKNKSEKGDILITRIGTIGFSKIVDWDGDFSTYVSLATIKQSKLINTSFLHYYLQSDGYQKEIQSKSLMNAVPCKINMEDLKKTKVLVPKSPDEQQDIASCFLCLDSLITAECNKLDALKDFKKGLMQQLFPQINK